VTVPKSLAVLFYSTPVLRLRSSEYAGVTCCNATCL